MSETEVTQFSNEQNNKNQSSVAEVENVQPNPADHPSTCWQSFKSEITHLRWRVLILICFMSFGQYYIMSFPGSIGTGPENTIQSRFFEHGKAYSQTMDQALYSVYSYPNMFLSLLGGLLIDKYLGINKATMLFISLILVGSIVFAIGVLVVNYPVVIIGYFIFGLGSESNGVSSLAYTVRYFADSKWLAFALGISITFISFSVSLTYILSPLIANVWNIAGACFVGAMMCGLSFVTVVILCIVDIRASAKGIVADRPVSERMNFKDILKFRPELWLLTAICIFSWSSLPSLGGNTRNFLEVKYKLRGVTASQYISIKSYISAIFSPIVGVLVDRVGYHPYWMMANTVGYMIIHMLILFTYTPPAVILIIMGFLGPFMVSGLWPSVPYVVDSKMVGFAYGLIFAIQNMGLATTPVIAGVILDKNTPGQPVVNGTTPATKEVMLPTLHGFMLVQIFYICMTIVTIILILALIFVDRYHGSILISKPSVRAARLKARDEQSKEKLADSIASVP